MLALLLPQADYATQAEREIVREIVVKVLLEDVFPRIVQPWFIQKQVLDLLGPPRHAAPRPPLFANGFSLHSLAILFLSAVQAVSTACLAALAVSQRTWNSMNALHTASATSPQLSGGAIALVCLLAEVLTMKARFASASVLSFIEIAAVFAAPYFDRYAPYVLERRVFTATLLHKIIVLGKKQLFPNGWPGPPPVDPTPEEQVVIRESLEIRLSGLFPGKSAITVTNQL
jgi:hypothetical protein